MAETTNGASDVQSAFELTHHRLQLLVKRLESATSPNDEQLEKQVRLSRRQVRQNREILGGAKKQDGAKGAGAAKKSGATQKSGTRAAKKG